MTTAPVPSFVIADREPPRPWSDRTRRMLLPALVSACYAGDGDRIINLCATEEPDPGLSGAVYTDPSDKRN